MNLIPKKNGFHSPGRRFLGLGSAVHIYIYATTIHELAHASHWSINSSDYNNSEDKLSESWARGVQWELVRIVWTDYYGGATIPPNYTQVVVDMIDNSYDFSNNGKTLISEDNVNGYTIRELEDALLGQTTWNGWKDNIKNKYNNATENNLDALFYAWN